MLCETGGKSGNKQVGRLCHAAGRMKLNPSAQQKHPRVNDYFEGQTKCTLHILDLSIALVKISNKHRQDPY